MNKFLVSILVICSSYWMISCSNSNVHENKHKNLSIYKDLDSIQSIKKLTVLLNYSPTSYFIYKGQPMGFDYELLKRYANTIGVKLEIIPIQNMDSIFTDLNKGVADVVASNLTVTEERLRKVAFTEPILVTNQVLIQRKPADWRKMRRSTLKETLLHSPLDLAGKTVTVGKNSSYYSRLKNLSNEIGGKININTVSGKLTTDELIEKVAFQQIEYTIADKNMAKVSEWQYPDLDANLKISLDQNIAWSTRKNSRKLTQSINNWLTLFKETKHFTILYNKYFRNQKGFNNRINHQSYTLKSGEISPYDETLRQNAPQINWDWELLASMIYQESHFNNQARGWGNSFGLMQFMPVTGAKYGVDTSSSAQSNIVAGVQYLKYLDDYWSPIISDDQQRIRFVLASYNVGPGHILDARRLAEKYNKDPFIWDDNVDYFLLNKSKAKYYNDEVVRHGYCKGFITYAYVNEIISRYEHYKQVVKQNEGNTVLTSK